MITLIEFHLSSPKPGHTTGGLGRQGAGRTAGRGDARQNKVPTFRSPWKPTAPLAIQRNVNNCSERYFASTNNGNTLETAEGTNIRLTTVLSLVHPQFITETASALRCWLLSLYQRLFVSVNLFHARHDHEFIAYKVVFSIYFRKLSFGSMFSLKKLHSIG